MKDCWDPEFEPSVEEIVDYPMISLWRFSQFAFPSELAEVIMRKFRASLEPFWDLKISKYVEYLTRVSSEYITS